MLGETLDGRYLLLRVLGQGGMGAVYEARHVGTGRRVAVKVIHAQMAESAEVVQRFHREARAAGSIETPHIAQVFDTGTDRATGVIYMAMELLLGEDLQHLLRRHGKLSQDLALRVAAQACVGLGKAHQAGVIHRDIKPANLFLSLLTSGVTGGDGDGVIVKVVDFGIAKTLDASGVEDASLTRTGGLVGSPLYVSPEQAMGRKTLDQRTDIWSLGVVLYQALAGRVPRPKTDTVVALMMGICTEPAPPLQDFAPWVHPQVAAIVHRMLAINPDARFQSAAEVLAAMAPWLPKGLSIRTGELGPITQAEETHVAPRAALESNSVTVRVSEVPPVAAGAEPLPRSPITGEVAALSVSQTAAGVLFRPRSMRRPLLIAALVLGTGGVIAYRLTDNDAAMAGAGMPSASAAVSVAVSVAAPPPAAPEERSARLAVDPPDARVTVDGNETPIEGGGVQLHGPLGSVHHVRVVKGSQNVDDDVAITSQGAVPSRLQIELAAGRSPLRAGGQAGPLAGSPQPPASATGKASAKPRPAVDRNFE